MQVGVVKIGDFRQITRYNSETSIFASIVNLIRSQVSHTVCLRHLFYRDAVRRAGSSATSDTCAPPWINCYMRVRDRPQIVISSL